MKKIILLLLFYFACETVVEIDIPKSEPMLVLNGFFNPDSGLSISLFRSFHILEPEEFGPIQLASVTIFDEKGGKKADLINSDIGIYTSSFIPEPGIQYRIEASKDGFETISSVDMIPKDSAKVVNIVLQDVTPLEDQNSWGGNAGIYEITFTIQDYIGEDFYEVQVLEYFVHELEGEEVRFKALYNLESEDPVFDDFNSSGVSLLFKDGLFDEDEAIISVESFLDFGNYCETQPECKKVETFLVLRKVSEAYFNYRRTLRLQEELDGNPFAEPVSVFNNIEGGFGIFAGYRYSKFPLQAPVD